MIIPFSEGIKYDFHEGLARINKNHKEGFIDSMGEEIIPAIYDSVCDFRQGHTELLSLGDTWISEKIPNPLRK